MREYVIAFDAAADDLVYRDSVSGPDPTNGSSLLNRFAGRVVPTLGQESGGVDSWVVQSPGAQEISTVTSTIRKQSPATVRLRKGVRMPDLVSDGPAVDFGLDGTGTLLYSLATGVGARLESTTTGMSAGGHWTVSMSRRAPWSCGATDPDESGPLGCGDNGFIGISDAEPSNNADYGWATGDDAVAVLVPEAGAARTVSVRLLSTPLKGP